MTYCTSPITLVAAGVVWVSVAVAYADIVQYHGADGRRYFTNLVSPTPQTWRLPQPPLAPPVSASRGWIIPLIHRLAQQHRIDPHLVQAIISVESNFNPRAVSPAGAQGLMQLMPATAARYQVDNPFDPHANITGGIRYLKDLLQLFPSDLRLVLAAYNAGEGAVQQHGGIPPYPETQRYVTRVITLYGAQHPYAKFYRYQTPTGSILFTDTPR